MKIKRILIKLSGEAFSKNNQIFDISVIKHIVQIISCVNALSLEVAIVVGGGNICRGKQLLQLNLNQLTGDHMGMLATVINALALSDALQQNQFPTVVMTSYTINNGMCRLFNPLDAQKELSDGKLVILSAGTGNPCFTTDTTAILRAIELKADIVFKMTNVDGIYSDDPKTNPNAKQFSQLSFNQAVDLNLKIMDSTAFSLCRDYQIPICVLNLFSHYNSLKQICQGKSIGTMIGEQK